MNSTFESLPEEKRENIITICLEEFGENGYDKASTNAIVKKAGISKGILFHYFGNKKNLFLYILDYSIDRILKQFYSNDEKMPTDLFDKLITWSINKVKVYYDLPLESKVVMQAFIDIPEELKDEMMERQQKIYTQNVPMFIKDIDTSKFREGVEPNKAIELLMMCLGALNKKYIDMYKGQTDKAISEIDKLFNEMKEYLEILKGGIYGSK